MQVCTDNPEFRTYYSMKKCNGIECEWDFECYENYCDYAPNKNISLKLCMP